MDFPPPEVVKIIEFIYEPLFKDPVFLRRRYVEDRKSIAEIACEISSSPSTVNKYLKAFGIPIRPADEKNKSRLAYGEAWKAGKVSKNKRESDTSTKIQRLRDQGFSFWKISDALNTLGVPTKTKRGKWHARSVQQVLERGGMVQMD